MKAIYWFSEINKGDLAIAGGKGANLGEMFNSGFPVPEGFCISAEAYFEFIRKNGIDRVIRDKLAKLDVNDTRALDKVSQELKNAILNAKMPQDLRADITRAYNKLCGTEFVPSMAEEVFVAVRSSATAEDLPEASFAGQQETYLNIKGADALADAVKKCWASLFGARAIYYRANQNFDHNKVGLCAVVQRMVNSDKAGVMFTVDPVSQDPNALVIEGGFGLGEAIVSGAITPDRYSIDKRSMRIAEKNINQQEKMIVRAKAGGDEWIDVPEEIQEKQKISDAEIMHLAKLGVQIEQHYGSPQDIEWAVEGDNIYIVQSRAITTLNKKKSEESVAHETQAQASAPSGSGKVILKGAGASPGVGIGPVRLVLEKSEFYKVQEGDVLVTRMTTPDAVPAMKKAVAIVTDEGGSTCHAAIVSRELGIPCIVGTMHATQVLKEGQVITVDAKRGLVYDGSVHIAGEEKAGAQSTVVAGAPADIITGTRIYVNLAEPELAEKVAKRDCDGIGLLRAEFMIAGMKEHPRKFIEEHREQEFIDGLAENIRTFCAAFYPRPVVYRATDFKTNEYRNLEGGAQYEPQEENPMIGYRGCFRYVKEPDVFSMELQAIRKVREEFKLKNLWLMIPFVRRTGELRHVKDMLASEGLYQTRDFKLWIMVEVPSTVLIIDKFLEMGIDGISFGTNDLTQLILGVDRDSPLVAEEFDERHEAVLRALRHVIKQCNKHGVTSSFCGQAVSVYPEVAEAVVRYGITSVSVNPDMIEKTRKIIASVEKKIVLEHARDKDDFNL
ncbi:MAG: phosphoenolpyruvate synthase, partial [Candidatus Micrarchaeota archaeon]